MLDRRGKSRILSSMRTHQRRSVRTGSDRLRVTASHALEGILRVSLDEISANEAGVRAGNAEAVHQMRVTARRLQSAIGMLGRFAGKGANHLGQECNWLIDELSAAREIDVFTEEVLQPILTEAATPPIAHRVQKVCLAERKKAYRRANAALSSPRFLRFLSRLKQLEAAAHLSGGQDDARDAASRELSSARRTLKIKKRIDELSNPRLHKLRLRTKRMRYSAEIAKGVIGRKGRTSDFNRLSKALSQLQSALGAINDITVHKKMLRDFIVRFAESKRDAENDSVREQIRIFFPKRKKRRRRLLKRASRAHDIIMGAGKCWI